ncbi:hypothetical protein FRB90_009953 [Tulasnella sp. 427]|nr:hypothetical protein FRB90_009953 [Tulasnella sp. 427]
MAPPEDLFMMYYNPDKGLLLFLEEDGTPLPETMGVDLLAKADHKGIRPLLLLAQAEGLIDKVPCGRLVSLDFQTHIDSGFYIRTNSQKDGLFQPAISLPGASRAFRFRMRSVDSQRTYLRFFPYIHDADETLRFWDVEAQEDLQLRIGRAGTSWAAWEIKRKIPELFDIARSQGYWKDFVDKRFSSSFRIFTNLRLCSYMFFSTELLLKRESGLGLLWLAATIGSKASFKKLNKKSILSADISKLCDMIAEPEEPLALRLSSNLLVGVARAQHEIFYNDVMTCFITLKRAFAEITSAENQLQGSLTLSKDQLTLRETGFDIELDVLDTVWIDPLPRQPTPLPSQDDVLPHATFERPPFRHSQSAQSAGERQRLNPLADNALDFSGPSDDPFREQDEPFFDGDQADMIEMDLGLDFGDNARCALRLMAQWRFQPLNDERERDVTASRHASAMNTPVRARRETEASSGQRNPKTPVSELVFGNPALPDVSSSGNASHSQFHESAFAVEVSPPAVEPDPKPKGLRKKRKQHPDMLLWDKKIELTEEELLRNREGYEERMKKERREVLAKQRRFEAANLVHTLRTLTLLGPLLGAVDPGLVSWYKGLVKAQHDTFSANGRVQIDDGFAVPGVAPALPKKRRKVASKDKEDAVIEPLDVPPAEVDALNGFPSDDTNGGGVPFDDNMDWMQDVPGGQDLGSALILLLTLMKEPEHGRRGSSVPSSDLGSHLTRKTQLKPASQRGSNPPWDQDADVPPLNEMMNTPGEMRRTRSLSVVQVGREDGNAIDAEGSFTFEEEAATNGARDTQDDSQMTDMSLITMQRTMEVGSAKFLTHLVTAVDPATKAISFDKYLTPGVIDRRVAAMGFYHVLGKSLFFPDLPIKGTDCIA